MGFALTFPSWVIGTFISTQCPNCNHKQPKIP
jgi:ribosomal protein S27E